VCPEAVKSSEPILSRPSGDDGGEVNVTRTRGQSVADGVKALPGVTKALEANLGRIQAGPVETLSVHVQQSSPPPVARTNPADIEAAATVREMVYPSTRVTFGAGVAVQSVLTGYESCRVSVKNLPLTSTKADVVTLFTQPGFDPAKFTVYPPRESNDRSHREAVVEFEDAEDGRNAVAGLDGIEFGSEKLKLVVFASKQGGMGESKDQNSHVLTVTWPAPSDTVFASYSSMDEANSKRTQLDNKTFNGRKVKTNIAKKPSTLPDMYWNPATISISGLEPGTPLTSIEKFCGATSIRMATRNTRSYNLNDAIPSLQSLVVQAHPEHHQSLTYEPNLVPNENGVVSTKITFLTWEHAKAVRDFLDQKPLPLCAQAKFFVSLPDPLHYTAYVPYPQYKAQEKLFQSLIPDQTDRSATTHLRILANQPNRAARIELSGSDKNTIGKLKVRIEQLTAGEKLPQWDPVFYGPEGERFLEKVYEESRAYIRVDKRQSTLKAFGEPSAVERAKVMIQKEVDRLASRQFEVFLKRASIRYFVDGARGSMLLKQEVGEGNVMLDVSSNPCKIVIQGGEAARHCLKKLINESLSDAIRSQHRLKDGETCPVCYDAIDQPYRLGCGHAYCHGCLNHFLLAASDTKKFPLSCMGDEGTCGVPIPIPVIQRFLLPAQVKRLLEVSFLDHLGRNPGKFRYCATPDCPEIYSLESGSGDGIFQCRSCFVSVCVSCGEDHDWFSCEEWKIHRDPGTQERLLENWAEGSENVKKCPTCKTLVEKNGSSDHMTCPKCDSYICWRCMGVFTPDTIYGHTKDVHGGM
jgi:RNA recognition motif-containing protein